jgi:hypothetical protein
MLYIGICVSFNPSHLPQNSRLGFTSNVFWKRVVCINFVKKKKKEMMALPFLPHGMIEPSFERFVTLV